MPSLDVNRVKGGISSVFAGFTSGQKTVLAISVVGLIVGGLLFTQWAAKPSYTPLFSNLAAEDAAAVTEELTSKGVSYELADGGATVLVPRDSVYQLRLDMSAQGLPTGGSSGYALLDKQGITTSEFRQRVDYQRAMEGELSKTIGALDGVSAATVHLVMPAEDLFSQDEVHPTASVLLQTTPGSRLAAGQVQAVVHLVASSVEGLSPDQVTVADSTGRVLSAPGQDGMSAMATDARSEQTLAFQTQLESSIAEMLSPVVGVGGAQVRVRAVLDFDERSSTIERFDEGEAAPALTESTSSETYTGAAGGVGGVLGPDAIPIQDEAAGVTDYQKEQAQRSFAVGKVTEQVKAAPGGVERLSVAVLLDGGGPGGGADQAEIERIVTAAAGLDLAAGDTLEVSRLAFDDTVAEEAEARFAAEAQARQRSEMIDLARTLGVVLIVAVVLFLAYRSARKAQVQRFPLAVAIDSPGGRDDGDRELERRAAAAVLDLPEVHELASPADGERLVVHNQIGDLIDRQPDDVAAVLRGWLADRRT